MIHETYNITWSRLSNKTTDEIFNELIETSAKIPRIDKIIDLWEESHYDDDVRMSMFSLKRYIEYMTHYPIPVNKFYLACDPNGYIGLTAYFDTYKLTMRFASSETITYIKWGDYREKSNGY